MELLIAWGHFLYEVFPDRITARNLRCEFGRIRIEVLDNRFFADLVINDGGTDLSLKGHCHRHSSRLSLRLVLGVKFLGLNLILLGGISENDNSHGVLEILWVLKINEETALSKLILLLLSCGLQLLVELIVLLLGLDCLGSLLSDRVGSSWVLNLKVNLLSALMLWLEHHELESLISHLVVVSGFLLLREENGIWLHSVENWIQHLLWSWLLFGSIIFLLLRCLRLWFWLLLLLNSWFSGSLSLWLWFWRWSLLILDLLLLLNIGLSDRPLLILINLLSFDFHFGLNLSELGILLLWGSSLLLGSLLRGSNLDFLVIYRGRSQLLLLLSWEFSITCGTGKESINIYYILEESPLGLILLIELLVLTEALS